MKKKAVRTDRAPKPAGLYSQAIIVGDLVFTAGFIGVDPATGELAPGGIQAQVRQTLDNLQAVLEQAGTSLANAVKVNAYLRDVEDFAAYNQVYREYFDQDVPPARTTVQVGRFKRDIAVEIEVIAHLP